MKNNIITLGQRWLSDAEPELGLGVVIEVDARAMTVLFPGSDESRVYARNNAPLTRILFAAGDCFEDIEGLSWQVDSVREHHGLMHYLAISPEGERKELAETRVSPLLTLARPKERLLAAQLEPAVWFRLRLAAARQRLRLPRQAEHGLRGARISLIPHQLSVASTVSSRLLPRVLLADEVGLGKTIEAGLILHAQVLQGRAQRILVLVPDSLVHQWLVEMRRRFNLAFSLFDLARCAALRSAEENPFASEQLIIAPLSLLTDHPDLLQLACQIDWDMLVVDEAHHLAWTPDGASDAYEAVATVASHSQGLLLLTATPEQLGLESHYARLRLLDPARYPSLEGFLAEHDQWDQVRDLADRLLDNRLDRDDLAQLNTLLGRHIDADQPADREQALQALLDRHGLGRVQFRNTRAAVGGFPQRQLQAVRLPAPAAYASWLAKGAIWPETRVDLDTWLEHDPRIPWLVEWLKQHRREKVLLITRSGPLSEALEAHLRLREGIRTAVFHEGMNLLERDRAAAYFADLETGAQILLCSEIGSEGRNFQFAHHLILLDLPDNPDQLEQRIGRLDRIGQRNTIQIHVPVLADSAQERLFRWYDEALDVFARCSPAAATVHEHYLGDLKPLLKPSSDALALDQLIADAAQLRDAFEADLAAGRDRLLELQSCRPALAQALVQALANEDADTHLDRFLLAAWEAFGVHVEDQGQDRSWILQPGEHQLIEHFPGLDPDGMTVTTERELALRHEDWQFLTWEHPMVTGLLEWLDTAPQGAAQVAVLRKTSVKPGTLLLEAWFEPETQAAPALALSRTYPAEPLRLLVDARGQDLADKVAADGLARQLDVPDLKLGRHVVKAHRDDIERLTQQAEALVSQRLEALRSEAQQRWQAIEGAELERLQALKAVNPAVTTQELQAQQQRLQQGAAALGQLNLRAVAMRLIIAA